MGMKTMQIGVAACALALAGFLSAQSHSTMTAPTASPTPSESAPRTETATLGGGCFWCLEALYKTLEGVVAVKSGYTGGHVANPTYKQVCTGQTGHAEVVQVTYDPAVLSFEDLLEFFWRAHNPTTLNRQGADVGTQYRSAIFYHNDAQRVAAEKSRAAADASGAFSDPIVTEIVPLGTFYPAEDYHQDYFAKNPYAPYCQMVIRPKLEKLQRQK